MTKKDSEKNKSYTNEHPKGVAPAPSKSKKKNIEKHNTKNLL